MSEARTAELERLLSPETPEELEELRGRLATKQLCVVKWADWLDRQNQLAEVNKFLREMYNELEERGCNLTRKTWNKLEQYVENN